MTKNNIEAAVCASNLLKEYGIQTVPIDVHALTDAMGIRVVAEALDDDTSGVVVIKGDQVVIGVNKFHHPRRQRFTIAHELGHYLLHGETANVFVDRVYAFFRDADSSQGTKDQEIQANAFAAELLMPEYAIKQYLDSPEFDLLDEVAVKRLASKFNVSEQALTIRLVRLGLITEQLLL